MKINKIKKNGKKYVITLDNGKDIITYDDVIIKHGLLYHRYISEKLLDKIYSDTAYFKSYNKVIDMINRRLRSEYEIRKYLIKNEIDESVIESIIKKLKKVGLIDDMMFAKAYTNDKVNLSLDGPYKIRKYLEDNKINDSIVNDVILNIDDNIINNHIDKIITKKIKSNTKYTSYALKQKIIIYLTNLGYDKNSIIKRLETFEINTPNMKKEMDKILNRLKKKNSGNELIYKLKSKLYQKGYAKEEIEDYIKNSSLV